MNLTIAVIALLTAAAGAAIGWLLARTRGAAETARLQAELAAARAQLESERSQVDARFRQLSAEILDEKARRLDTQSREGLEQVLKPLRERLQGFEQQVKQTYEYETRDRVALKEQIALLQKLNQQVSTEASQLATALKGQSKTRGDWGQLVVERILEMSGLTAGREYEAQYSAPTEDGGRRFPDFVVHLPGGRDIVIDAKLPLLAYLRAAGAADEPGRKAAIADHVAAVRLHVRDLASKDYSRLYGIQSLDFVLMCIPNEAAYIEALQAEPDLYQEAFGKRIVLVSPSNLWPTLRAVENMWRLERQTENAAEIARRGGQFYDKLMDFFGDLKDVEKHLQRATDAHGAALNKLGTGKGNLLNKAEGLRKLGVAVKKQLPLGLKSEGDDEDEGPAALEDRSA